MAWAKDMRSFADVGGRGLYSTGMDQALGGRWWGWWWKEEIHSDKIADNDYRWEELELEGWEEDLEDADADADADNCDDESEGGSVLGHYLVVFFGLIWSFFV